ncbi:hypothetical protein M885DRAFT_556766 [Pelagophyceae sp. CCMP2097]|nr:hypothetical protein M885DRAFT_556766 [Pelagophyceae sp. CCMP2097]
MSPHGDTRRAESAVGGLEPISGTDRPDRPAPSLRGGSAATKPLAYEAWDVEAVAMVVYWCCCAQEASTDAFKKAADVADVFYEAEVTGGALAELLRNDASHGFTLLEDVLPKLGSRAAVLGALRAYTEAHRREECGAFGKFVSTMSNLSPGAEDEVTPPVQLSMPLFVTVVIKKLKDDDADADKVFMVGTLVIRSLVDMDKLVGADGKPSLRPFLKMNEREDTLTLCTKRSSEVWPMDHPTDEVCDRIQGRSTTYSFEVSTKRRSVYSELPFNITKFELDLDFEPLVARLPGGELMEFLPDLLCPTRDLRNLISVRPEELDELKKFDIVNPNPSVEIMLREKGGVVHAPKMRITFYGHTDPKRGMVNIVVPILAIVFGCVLNVLFAEDDDNFMANVLTLLLTVVFFIPVLNETDNMSDNKGHMVRDADLLIFYLFLGAVRYVTFICFAYCVSIPYWITKKYFKIKKILVGVVRASDSDLDKREGSHLEGSWFTVPPAVTGKPTSEESSFKNLELARRSVQLAGRHSE